MYMYIHTYAYTCICTHMYISIDICMYIPIQNKDAFELQNHELFTKRPNGLKFQFRVAYIYKLNHSNIF